MIVILFTWYLLTFPTDRLICSLWINQPPEPAALVTSCGTDKLINYRLDVIPLGKTASICSQSASELFRISELCALPEPLDHYRLKIIKPAEVLMECAITVKHEGEPTAAEVNEQCGVWHKPGTLQLVKTEIQKPPAPRCAAAPVEIDRGLYGQPINADELWTTDDLMWLAGRLIWFGVVPLPQCPPGVPIFDDALAATPCGMDAARSKVVQWQNSFNAEIFDASIKSSVPARLLKRIMLVESQFWPMWGAERAGEIGMIQVTDNGLDVLMRYDPSLDLNYAARSDEGKLYARQAVRAQIRCELCNVNQAVDRTRAMIPMYARILAAYRCRAVEINPSLSGTDAWRQAAVDFNGSTEYLRRIEE